MAKGNEEYRAEDGHAYWKNRSGRIVQMTLCIIGLLLTTNIILISVVLPLLVRYDAIGLHDSYYAWKYAEATALKSNLLIIGRHDPVTYTIDVFDYETNYRGPATLQRILVSCP